VSFEFKLPDLGEGVAEGEIVSWKVTLGDHVEEDQPLVEVMTDKATVEIPAPKTGKIEKILAEPGAVVPVGEVLVVIDDAASEDAAVAPAEEEATPTATPEPAPAPPVAEEKAPPAPAAGPTTAAAGQKVLATPSTRKLARELGVDIANITGTGPRGRITQEDVRASGTTVKAPVTAPADVATATPLATGAPSASDERIPYRGLRKAIGDQMVKSAYTAPHFTLVEEVDMTEIARLRQQFKPEAERMGFKLTYLPFVVKALATALQRHPILNSTLDEEAGEVVLSADAHVGFALDTERGLMVPVIRDARRRNIYEIAAELQRLSEAGRSGSITREELSGSTITISSAGSIGGLFATPIINHPEVAILGVYRIEDRPVVMDGEIVVRKMMYLSVTLDHRVVDGGEAARFLNTMKSMLGDPSLMVMGA